MPGSSGLLLDARACGDAATYGRNALIAADQDGFASESLRKEESQDQSVSLSVPGNA